MLMGTSGNFVIYAQSWGLAGLHGYERRGWSKTGLK